MKMLKCQKKHVNTTADEKCMKFFAFKSERRKLLSKLLNNKEETKKN